MESKGETITKEIQHIEESTPEELSLNVNITVGEVKDLTNPKGNQALTTELLAQYLQALNGKTVERFTIKSTKATYRNTSSKSCARNNFLNGFYKNSGFLGIGQSNFEGNSLKFSKYIYQARSLQHLIIECRLKCLDLNSIAEGLKESPCQLQTLYLTAIPLTENSMKSLSEFLQGQQCLK